MREFTDFQVVTDADAARPSGRSFTSLPAARDAVREWRRRGGVGPARVLLADGVHRLTEPLRLGPLDSDVCYAAAPGARAVVSGGVRLSGWRVERVDGVVRWTADAPRISGRPARFRQLVVDGGRRTRPSLPKRGWFEMADVPGISSTPDRADDMRGTDTFVCRRGDIQPWRNLADVEVVVHHYWIQERMPIEHFDPATGLVRSSRRSAWALRSDYEHRFASYRVENVFEALTEPGEWYLDTSTETVHYLPKPGEDPESTVVVAPVLLSLVEVDGAGGVGFEGLEFAHTDWELPDRSHPRYVETGLDPGVRYASAPQAAFDIPGAVRFSAAERCWVRDCVIAHTGGYAVEIGEACRDLELVGNHLADLGAGGVKVDGGGPRGPIERRTGRLRITDNHIEGGGRVFAAGVGILCLHAYACDLSHNDIHDFSYTGISVGWQWDYDRSVAADIRIENNRIHNLGHGLLSDLGGVYLLGVQPGTVVAGNVVHGVEARSYGGWGIYLDEGSSHIVVENNVCFDVSSQCFHQHFGRENIIRNNLFAFGREGVVKLSRRRPWEDDQVEWGEWHRPPHRAFTLMSNVLVSDDRPAIVWAEPAAAEPGALTSDLNCLWDVSAEVSFGRDARDEHGRWGLVERLSPAEWQAKGFDRHSRIVDLGPVDEGPMERAVAALGQRALTAGLGFEPVSLDAAGPRPAGRRGPRYGFAMTC